MQAADSNYPNSIRPMVALIGAEAVQALIDAYGGGRPIYVPNRAKEQHAFVELIGFYNFVVLAGEYGGTRVRFPSCRSRRAVELRARVLALLMDGLTGPEVARVVGVTVRHVRGIKRAGLMTA